MSRGIMQYEPDGNGDCRRMRDNWQRVSEVTILKTVTSGICWILQ